VPVLYLYFYTIKINLFYCSIFFNRKQQKLNNITNGELYKLQIASIFNVRTSLERKNISRINPTQI